MTCGRLSGKHAPDRTIPTLTTPEGNTAKSNNEKATALAGISFPGSESYQGSEGVPGQRGEAMTLLEEDDSFVERAINSQRARKAPGIDGIGAPVIKLM